MIRSRNGDGVHVRSATLNRGGGLLNLVQGPKAAVHLQHDLPYNTECYAKAVLGIREDDITISVPKLFFGYRH